MTFEQWPEEPVLTASVYATGADVKLDIFATSNKGIKTLSIDFGDGTIINANVACYTYDKAGEYTVKCTAVDNEGNSKTIITNVITTKDGNKDFGEAGKVRNLAPFSAITVTDTLPTGSGSKDINVIRDGSKANGNINQYDTYVGYLSAHEDYIGYLFPGDFEVSKVVFTEGLHFNNGGWFADGTLRLEALIDGEWEKIDVSPNPAYPMGNAMSLFGSGLESYIYNLDNVVCSAYGLSARPEGMRAL